MSYFEPDGYAVLVAIFTKVQMQLQHFSFQIVLKMKIKMKKMKHVLKFLPVFLCIISLVMRYKSKRIN